MRMHDCVYVCVHCVHVCAYIVCEHALYMSVCMTLCVQLSIVHVCSYNIIMYCGIIIHVCRVTLHVCMFYVHSVYAFVWTYMHCECTCV